MRLSADEARARFVAAPVARLATVGPDGRPHIVPIVFAVDGKPEGNADGDVLYSAADAKPKSTTALRRLANIEANPAVAGLVDHYADDWTQLWWARVDGTARIAGAKEAAHALGLLTARYPVYADEPPPGPVLVVDVARWSGWAAS